MAPEDQQPGLTALDREIGIRIRLCRRARRMTLRELGAIVGDPAARVADYETGREAVAAVRLYEIAVALSVDVDALFPAPPEDAPKLPQPGDLGLVG